MTLGVVLKQHGQATGGRAAKKDEGLKQRRPKPPKPELAHTQKLAPAAPRSAIRALGLPYALYLTSTNTQCKS